VNLCDDTHHLNDIFKTGPRATNVVFAGDLVPTGTVLVTPALVFSMQSRKGYCVETMVVLTVAQACEIGLRRRGVDCKTGVQTV